MSLKNGIRYNGNIRSNSCEVFHDDEEKRGNKQKSPLPLSNPITLVEGQTVRMGEHAEASTYSDPITLVFEENNVVDSENIVLD